MRSVVQMLVDIEQASTQQDVQRAMRDALEHASTDDLPWLLGVLLNKRVRAVRSKGRAITIGNLKAWALELTGIPVWLYEESQALTGDAAETVALLVQGDGSYTEESLSEFMHALHEVRSATADEQKLWVLGHWRTMTSDECLVFNKLVLGALRVKVDRRLVVQVLSAVVGVDVATLSYRLLGDWTPQTLRYEDLIAPDEALRIDARPYEFCFAFPHNFIPDENDVIHPDLGDIRDWQAEWAYRGTRVQVIVRNREMYVWTSKGELVNDSLPGLAAVVDEVTNSITMHDGLVLDGVIVHGANTTSQNTFIACDMLEHNGIDVRRLPLAARRTLLTETHHGLASVFALSPIIDATTWSDLARHVASARLRNADGIILKRIAAPYEAGSTQKPWLLWKSAPHTLLAVVMYAQTSAGSPNTYSDFTFGVWKDGVLVPVAKTTEGLTEDDVKGLAAFVRANTTEKFGPVRTVKPELVFELCFDSIEHSSRHKSGFVIRAVRVLGQRADISPTEAATVASLKQLLP